MSRFVRPVTGWAVLMCVVILAGVALEIFANKTTGAIVDRVQSLAHLEHPLHGSFRENFHAAPVQRILLLIIVLGSLVAGNAIAGFFRNVVTSKFTMEMVFYMRGAVYDRLQNVGFAFFDSHTSGALINRALADLQNVRGFIQTALSSAIEIVAVVIGYNILLFSISPWVGLAALIPLPFWIWYIQRYSRKMQPAQQAAMQAGDDVVTVLTENISGVHVVKAFATERTEIQKYHRATDILFAAVMYTVKLTRNFQPTIRGIASFSHLSLFAVGAALIASNRLQVGNLLIIGGAMGAILGRLQQIAMISDQYQKAIVSGRRFYEVLDAPPTVPEKVDAPDLPAGPGAVEFHFVTFGYDPKKPVVRDIAFDCAGGSVIAVVGPTGSGKSTLMQLLARFYDPQTGSIIIDKTDIRDVRIRSLRRQIGFVFQETFLFSDTVANNIGYGNPDVSRGEVEAAARLAQAHEFIMEMPLGYDTVLGERGASLSGGQRQRLAIARAIISNPRILVLDDALSAVDPQTEHLISRALELVMVDRTVFVIAHRLSTVKAADLVIVLENGRITQAGTHKDLLREEGHYRHIAQVQLAYQEEELLAKAAKREDKAALRQ
jgi:ABC-type multidrug transport system fused ATPase/permease subunit